MAMTADQVREVDRVQDICDKFNQKIEAEQRKVRSRRVVWSAPRS